MALMYDVELTPGKPDFVRMLLERAGWFDGQVEGAELVGHYRFDDPAGEVGIEAHVVRTADGAFWHVPLTYRGEPLEAAAAGFVTTSDHPVLGTRYVHDACHDPVGVSVLAGAIATGTPQATEEPADGGEPLDPGVAVHGSGSATDDLPPATDPRPMAGDGITTLDAGAWELVVVHRVGTPIGLEGADVLTGTWDGQGEPAVLAAVRRTR